jgi:glycosyltransferase involved in cell wall biosynthesis
MTQDAVSSYPGHRLGSTIHPEEERAFWRAHDASLKLRNARILIIEGEIQKSSTYWNTCIPQAKSILAVDPLKSTWLEDGSFDVVIDVSDRPPVEAMQTFRSVFAVVATSGLYVFIRPAIQNFLAALSAECEHQMLEKIHAIEFGCDLCIVRKDGVESVVGPATAAVPDGASETYRLSQEVLRLRADVELEGRAFQRATETHAQKIAEIHASTSWRVTAPLRWIGTQVLRGRNVVRMMRSLQAHEDGMLGGVRHVLRTLRRVGIANVAEAIDRQSTASDNYAEWVHRYDTLDDAARIRLLELVQAMPAKPLISVLMPVYNPRVEWLERAIASVQAQIYPRWELCIADDASPDPAGREALARLAAEDDRIKVVHRTQNGHISAASNSALELVEGSWTALMDQDDLLPAHALAWVAHAINTQPNLRLVYSDEDKVDDDDRRFDPYFKSDWNRDLFLSQNMFSHLGVYQTDLLRKVGGFRQGFEGAQDHDLVLRCMEHIRPDQIHHIPKVLYHWRVHADSTASSTDAKPYAQIAGTRALNEHFQRTGVKGHIESLEHGYRAHYDLPNPAPRVSLIIPTRNAASLVRQCVDSIVALTTYPNYEIVLVDNGSNDVEAVTYFRELASRPGFKVIRDDGEFNYSALNNKAVAQSSGRIIGLVNNDIEVISPNWLSEMVSIAIQTGVGAVGARLWYPDETLQHGGVVLGIGGVANHSHKHLARGRKGYFGRADLIQSFSAVTAACLVVDRVHYEAVGGLDEVNLKVAFNDVDFCLRLREAGLRNVWTPYAELFHHESATRGEDIQPEKRQRFVAEVDYMMQHWGSVLERDPAYNPNLTSKLEDFTLSWPPRDPEKLQ